MKKALIRLARSYLFSPIDMPVIVKLENGYIFGNKYYKTIDDMQEDLIKEIKKHLV